QNPEQSMDLVEILEILRYHLQFRGGPFLRFAVLFRTWSGHCQAFYPRGGEIATRPKGALDRPPAAPSGRGSICAIRTRVRPRGRREQSAGCRALARARRRAGARPEPLDRAPNLYQSRPNDALRHGGALAAQSLQTPDGARSAATDRLDHEPRCGGPGQS